MVYGITFFGLCTSAAMMLIISALSETNIMILGEAMIPCQPCDIKPPRFHKFSSPVVGELWSEPKKVIPVPIAIMAIAATALISGSQNPVSSNTRTLYGLIVPIKKMMLKIRVQRGTSGYHSSI